MTTSIVTVNPDTQVYKIARLLLQHHISAVPVVDDRGRVMGMVSEGDLMRRSESGTEGRIAWWLDLLAGPEERARMYLKSHGLTARDVMTRNVITADENTPLEKIATLLERNHIKRVPVLRRGKLVGIASRANLLHGLVARGGKGANAASQSTTRIRNGVMAEFRRMGLRTDLVNVVVADGIVQLWGWVESATQRKALALAARRVTGVKSVKNLVSIQKVTVGWE
jgi:CBS domain-containing protein